MDAILEEAAPLVQLLWRRETEGQVFDSPERKAALDARLRKAIMLIKDGNLRSHYGSAIAELRRELFNPQRQAANYSYAPRRMGKAPAAPTDATRASALARGDGDHALLEATILLAAILAPETAKSFEAELDRLMVTHAAYRPLHNACLLYTSPSPRDA